MTSIFGWLTEVSTISFTLSTSSSVIMVCLPPVFDTGLVSDWQINLFTSLRKAFRLGINLTFVILNSFLKLRLTVEILRTDPNSRIIHISCSLLKGLLTRRPWRFDISFLIFSNVHMWQTFCGFQKKNSQIFSC